MFDPEQLRDQPPFTWQAVEDTEAIISYRHFYRLDKVTSLPGVQHCFGKMGAGGFSVLVQAFIHPANKANVFLLHGYTDHLGLYDQLILALMQAGFNVVGLDLPGHGLSVSGERAGIQGFQQYQQAIMPVISQAFKQLSGSWALIGQSTGGAIAMDYILNNPQHGFDRLVLLAPLVIPARWPWVKFQLFAARTLLQAVPRRFNHNSGDTQFLRFVKYKDPLQARFIRTSWVQSLYDWQAHFASSPSSTIACLLIQGGKDTVVDGAYNAQRIEEKFSHIEHYYLADANHHLANEVAAIRTLVFQRVKAFLMR